MEGRNVAAWPPARSPASRTPAVRNARNPDFQSAGFPGRDRRAAERRAETRRTPASRSRPDPTRFASAEAANRELSVTVSIGVAEPDAKARGPEQVIQAADKALYRAKQSGRNRVEFGPAPRPAKSRRNIA